MHHRPNGALYAAVHLVCITELVDPIPSAIWPAAAKRELLGRTSYVLHGVALTTNGIADTTVLLA